MKVKKLLFYLNGWNLAITGAPVISNAFEFGNSAPWYHRFITS